MHRRMKVCLTAITASLFTVAAAAQAIEKPPRVDVDGKISWVYDYAEGQLLSQASGKPMFVVFRCER